MPSSPRLVAAALVMSVVAIITLGAQAGHEKHWGYEDNAETVGPAKWATLPGDATCGTGTQQTPIDLVSASAKPQDLPDLVFNYKPSHLSVLNNGHTEQMTYDPGSTLGRAGSAPTWNLAQFHFHAPSEHTLDGQSFPMEVHLVHVDAAGKPVAVVGVFIKAGRENAGLAKAFQMLPAKEGDKNEPAGATVNADSVLPADRTFFTYPGSLTTPPCTEGLTWFVLKAPIELSQAQINAFTRLEHLGHTNRPIQSLGRRTVMLDSTRGK
jgi:carbonic anhydrase